MEKIEKKIEKRERERERERERDFTMMISFGHGFWTQIS